MRVLWLVLLLMACTPTYINSFLPVDGGSDVAGISDGFREESRGEVAVGLDVPILLDAFVIDRPVALDQSVPVDRPLPRDVVLVSDTPAPWPFGLRPGDRIKLRSSATVYLFGSDGRRHLFFNELVYYSWYLNQVGIIELADRDLASILPGPNVQIRPGTWLIKIQTAPQLYAVARCGVRQWITTESLGRGLFGPMWNVGTDQVIPVPGVRRARDLSEAYFTDYHEGAALTARVHPDGSLIRYAGSAERYLIQGGMRRRISPEGFVANRWNEAFLTISDIAYPDGAPITGYEPLLSDPTPCRP